MSPALFVIGILSCLLALVNLFQNKNNLAIILTLIGVVSIITAFWLRPEADIKPEEQQITKIRISGSKTLGKALMPGLIQAFIKSKNYLLVKKELLNNQLNLVATDSSHQQLYIFEISSTGSLSGLKMLAEDQCELAMASTAMQEEQIQSIGPAFKKSEHEHIIAYDAIKVIIHPSKSSFLQAIQLDSLGLILSGEINDWSAIHPQLKGKINCYIRDQNSGTYKFIRTQLLDTLSLREDLIQKSYFEQIETAIASDSSGIGFVNYAIDKLIKKEINTIALKDSTSAAEFPNSESIVFGRYPLARPLFLYVKSNSKSSALIKEFLQFCKEKTGRKVILENGLVPNYH